MLAVVCSDMYTNGDMEAPVVIRFDSREEARQWILDDVAEQHTLMEEDGRTANVDRGGEGEERGDWWYISYTVSWDGDYERIMTWDIVDIYS